MAKFDSLPFSLPIVIHAAAGVSSVFAQNNQLLLTPRSTPADSAGKLSFRATAARLLSARGGTGRLSAVRERWHPDHRRVFCRGQHPDDRWCAERNGHSVRGSPRARHHLYHGFHERRRQNRGRRNPGNPAPCRRCFGRARRDADLR